MYEVPMLDTPNLDEDMGYLSDIFSWTLASGAYLAIQVFLLNYSQIMHETI